MSSGVPRRPRASGQPVGETAIASVAGEVNSMTPDFCVSADGRRLIYGQVDLSNTDLKVLENVQ
jgi:hypothetical protein